MGIVDFKCMGLCYLRSQNSTCMRYSSRVAACVGRVGRPVFGLTLDGSGLNVYLVSLCEGGTGRSSLWHGRRLHGIETDPTGQKPAETHHQGDLDNTGTV